jgi:CRISPR-associated Csx2 family protein
MTQVFISFLGAIPYQDTQYYFGDKEKPCASTPYVQEAILSQLAERGKAIGQVFVFTTKDAAENNYFKQIKSFNQETGKPVFDENGRALESRLADLIKAKVIKQYESVLIPEGNSEAEIFKVFGILHEKLSVLPADTEVIFDITYGFRSLPLLCIVLLNYVRTLHNIRVAHIFYGNFEVGRHEQQQELKTMRENGATTEDISAFKSKPTQSPVLDLRAFADLQEWTSAARVFLEGGNAKPLAELMPPEKQEIGQAIQNFTDQILTCRGNALSVRKDLKKIKKVIGSLQLESNIEAQLRPILEKIEQKMAGFSDETSLNGFAAVRWCIQHNLIQQGYTFLEETCKSFLIEKTVGLEHINNPVCRQSAGTALKAIHLKNWGKAGEVDMTLTQEMADLIKVEFPRLVQFYRKLTGFTGLRNDINHCGYMLNPKSPEALKSDLEEVFQEITSALKLQF